jgi:hypothetical protein
MSPSYSQMLHPAMADMGRTPSRSPTPRQSEDAEVHCRSNMTQAPPAQSAPAREKADADIISTSVLLGVVTSSALLLGPRAPDQATAPAASTGMLQAVGGVRLVSTNGQTDAPAVGGKPHSLRPAQVQPLMRRAARPGPHAAPGPWSPAKALVSPGTGSAPHGLALLLVSGLRYRHAMHHASRVLEWLKTPLMLAPEPGGADACRKRRRPLSMTSLGCLLPCWACTPPGKLHQRCILGKRRMLQPVRS